MSSYSAEQVSSVVGSVAITEEDMAITYVLSSDMRDRGRVAMEHNLIVLRGHPEYGEAVEEIIDSVKALLQDVLEDWDGLEPMRPPEPEDEDDESYTGSD